MALKYHHNIPYDIIAEIEISAHQKKQSFCHMFISNLVLRFNVKRIIIMSLHHDGGGFVYALLHLINIIVAFFSGHHGGM